MLRIITLLPMLLLLGCAGALREGPAYLHTSLAPGDRLSVSGDLTVPPGTRTVYLQGGTVLEARGLTIWSPSCRVVMSEPTATRLSLDGSEWEVGGFRLFEQDTSFDTLTKTTMIGLVARRGPDVESLICARAYGMNEYQRVPVYITREEFEQAVGAYVSRRG
jgi:hypothetical protein